MPDKQIPLFPLNTVLFPGGPLPLRVFEARYLDMVSNCMKKESEFGVVLIADGAETSQAQTFAVGTRARITDWFRGSDGILGITATGTHRFSLDTLSRQDDGLYLGEVDDIDDDPSVALPEEFRPMADLLESVLDDLGLLYQSLERQYGDASWVSCRLAEILPMSMPEKQACLEMNDPVERLRFIRPHLKAMRSVSLQ